MGIKAAKNIKFIVQNAQANIQSQNVKTKFTQSSNNSIM